MCEDACFLCRRCGIIGKTGPAMGRTPARANTINGPFVNGPYVKPWFCRRGDSRIARKDQSEVCAMELPKRKQIRLPDYDYSSPGAYFVTICTHEKRCILSSVAVGAAISRPPEVRLTRYGEIVDLAIQNIASVYPHISIDKYVIMPNHVHLILQIHTDKNGRLIAAPTVSTIIGQMKRWASRQAKIPLWQKSYHEHVIRSEADYREIWEYIDTNPARWAEDRYYAP